MLTPEQKAILRYSWPWHARPHQLAPPGDWMTWLVLAGRGFGKTRLCIEWLRHRVEAGTCGRIALVGATAADVRDITVEGESGILANSPPWFRPVYQPSKRKLTWPNGAVAYTYSAEEPDQLRGPQHDAAICEELAKWKYPDDAWSNLQFGLRLGTNPQAVIATTPRPIKALKDIMSRASTVVTRGSMYENILNLPQAFINTIMETYEGTRLGRQEIYAEILDDNPNALWSQAMLEALRVRVAPALHTIAVGVDPSITAGGAETGIIVAGKALCACKGKNEIHAFVLHDASIQGSPGKWASAVVTAAMNLKADRIVGEVNQGGDMVEHTIRAIPESKTLRFKGVHASRGKYTRADPIAALYEQGKVHHVGMLAKLEDQMTQWEPGMPSPDRMDALVWVLTDLMVDQKAAISLR